ncbi:MAG: hypothetical protein ACOC1X_04750 [Promethearchaeota archaeon]
MSLAKRLADKVSIPTKKFYSEEIEEEIPVAQLSIGGLEKVDERIDRENFDLWNHILSTFSENLEEAQDAENPEDVDVGQKAMINFLSELDYELQVEMAWESFKTSMDEKVTKEQADKIYSFGLSDDQQMQALMFMLQGVQEEVQEELEEDGTDSGNLTTSTSDKEQ